jgi:hypothetical protein
MSYSDVARAAHVYARASAYTANREMLHKKYPVPADAADLIQLPPASHGSARHTATLHFYFYRDASALGTKAGRTPLSVAGPGCSGSLLALADKGQYRAVASAALGAEAILDWPFTDWRPSVPRTASLRAEPLPGSLAATRVRVKRKRATGTGPDTGTPAAAAGGASGDPSGRARTGVKKRRAAKKGKRPRTAKTHKPASSGREGGVRPRPCCLCCGPEETIYHLALECPHADMLALRREMWSGVSETIKSTWEAGAAIIEERAETPSYGTLDAQGYTVPFAAGACLGLALACPSFRESDGGKFLAYWTLMATTWPRHPCAAQPDVSFAVPALIGAMFDALSVRQGVLRRMAVTWLTWSDSHINRLARSFRAAKLALPAPIAAGGAAPPAPPSQ